MMRSFSFCLFLGCFIYCHAQKTLDKAYLKCAYDFVYLKDTLSDKKSDGDLLYLQIGEKSSKCFSYYTFQSDSLRSTPGYHETFRKMVNEAMAKGGISSLTSSVPHKRMRTCIYKNYPEGKITVTDGISLEDFIYEDDLNAQYWQIMDSLKTILDYPCQKAECHFRGRQWTAWFTPDIPIGNGPWKFGGLPGLIMEVYDRGKQYHFVITGLQQVEKEPIVFGEYTERKKWVKTNRKDFLKAEKRYLMDVNGYIELETGINLEGGAPAKVLRYDLLELDYK